MRLRLLRWLEWLFGEIGWWFELRADSVDPAFRVMLKRGVSEAEQYPDERKANWEAEAILQDNKWSRLDSKEVWEVE